jgi:hypothetical protein
MQTWWRAAVVAVVSMAGLGYAVGSVLGDDERLPDVGAPVVLGTSGDLPAHERADDELGGIVYPDPEGDREGQPSRDNWSVANFGKIVASCARTGARRDWSVARNETTAATSASGAGPSRLPRPGTTPVPGTTATAARVATTGAGTTGTATTGTATTGVGTMTTE